jgi:phage baseplate assembly protein W
MAIIDTEKTKKPYIVDRDEDVFIGLDFPFRIGVTGEGWGASTKLTLDAVKENIRNLIQTEKGERLMQPRLGLKLKQYLFEPFTEDTLEQIRLEIVDTINFWLPFVTITNIEVKASDNQAGDFKHVIEIFIQFGLKKDPNTLESVNIKVGG